MKRIVFTIVALCCLSAAYAQEEKKTRVSADVFVEQSMMLNDWFGDSKLNDGMMSKSIFEIGARLNIFFKSDWGIWGEAALGWAWDKSNSKACMNVFNEFDLDNHYYYDGWGSQPENFSGSMSLGISRRINLNSKWNIVPSLGVGMWFFEAPRVNYTLKEKDSNNVYDVDYQWATEVSDNRYTNDAILCFLSAAVRAETRLSDRCGIFLSLKYKPYLTRMKFNAKATDAYDHSIVYDKTVKGNFMSSLGIAMGVSF